jgi:hypothetical protein
MNIAASPDQTPATVVHERRKRPELRLVFEAVIHRLEPFFSKTEGLNGGTTDYWAARVIHEAHPALTAHDVKVLVDAAARYFRERSQTKTA